MSVTEVLRRRAERGEARGADQIWRQAVAPAGSTAPSRPGRRGRLLAAAGLLALAGIGSYLLVDRLDDGQSALVVGDGPPASSDDAPSVADAASAPADPCTGQVVVINATTSPGVASVATAILRAVVEARTASGATDAQGLGLDPVADPHQGAHEVDKSVVLLPSSSCPALENLVASELQIDVSYRDDWPDEYRSVLDSSEIQLGAQDIVVILGRELPEPMSESGALVPDVIGLLADSARLTLERPGFLVVMVFEAVTAGSSDIGRVTRQDPPAGGPVEPGSVVTLTVGEPAPGEAAPQVAGPAGDGLEGAKASVAGQVELDEVGILPCDASAEQFKSGTVVSPTIAASPIDALASYVNSWAPTDDQPNNMPFGGWFELILPDADHAYGWNASGTVPPPDEFNIVLWLESDSRGWFVSRWESSGC